MYSATVKSPQSHRIVARSAPRERGLLFLKELAMPDLDLIKQAEQGVRDGQAVFAGQDGQRYPHPSLPRSRGREGRGSPPFYSRDIGRIWRVAEALEYGIVGINK